MTETPPATLPPAPRWVFVTLELAEFWLHHNEHNRMRYKSTWSRYAEAMSRGKFLHNGQVNIILAGTADEPVELLNGQHQLEALLMYGEPMWMLLSERIAPETWATMDGGKPRHFTHDLERLGVPNAARVSAATRMLYLWLKGDPRDRIKVERFDLLDFYLDHRDIDLSVRAATGISRSVRGSASVLAAAHYRCRQVDAGDADRFFSSLTTGADLSTTSPLLHLRKYLIMVGASKDHVEQDTRLGMIATAWNLWRDGYNVTGIKYKHDRAAPFPEPK